MVLMVKHGVFTGDLTMPQFILKINLGNDAMRTNFDLGSKLMGIGNKITYGGRCVIEPGDKETITDINGNVVGSWEIVE